MVTEATTDDRQGNGQFAKGNPGGPGRPRRSVEIEYLAKLSDVVTLDDFARIAERAKADAIDGDARAREWLSKYFLGANPLTLTRLAAMEALHNGSTDKAAEHRVQEAKLFEMMGEVLTESNAKRNKSSTSDSKARDREPERNDDLW